MDIKLSNLNKIKIDENGNKSGILALNKPVGITSHDLVDRVRDRLNVKKVGHTGTLDPFASGLMIVLIGKNTKLSQQLLARDKEYIFELILGISTDTQDINGEICKIDTKLGSKEISKSKIKKVLDSFTEKYIQKVPLYSSIKMGGVRLRELARSSDKIIKHQNDRVTFKLKPKAYCTKKLKRQKRLKEDNTFTTAIPKRQSDIYEIKLLKRDKISKEKIKSKLSTYNEASSLPLLKIKTKVSKGTYIRQLGVDIGIKLGQFPSVLYSLKRTRIGKIGLSDIITLTDI